jgi:hypothetical protein
MWAGSSRSDLENELARIPIVTTDPVVRDLARRILLTRAEVPVGPSHRALITIRLQKLLDGGLIDESGALASQSQLPNDAEFARVQAEAFLYAGRAQDVCSDKTNSRQTSAEPFWLQLRIFCYVSAGDIPAADLTRSVLAMQGGNDAGFNVLIGELQTNHAAPPGSLLHPSPVDVFLLRKMGLAVTPQIASQLGTAASVLAVRDTRNQPVERLSAAEHIASTGAVGPDELTGVADAQSFSAEEKRRVGQDAASLPFLTRQILFRQAAALEPRPDAKFSLIRRADPALNEPGPFSVFAALEAANVVSIPPSASAGQTSWLAARVLILGGRPDAATDWLGPPENPLIAEAGLALDILLPGTAHDSLAQTDLAWLGAHATTDSGGWPAATQLSIGIWNALGLAVPPDAVPKNGLVQQTYDGELLTSEQLEKLDDAATNRSRRGEAVLRLLNVIGSRSPARFSPDATVHLVGVLQGLGLHSSARALAAECLLLGPPPPSARPSPSIAVPVPPAHP